MVVEGPVLVTGAGGLLGREVAQCLAAEGHDVRPLARDDLDVTDPQAVKAAVGGIRPAAVVHCAAFTNVDACEDEQERAWAVNAKAPGHVARAAEEAGAELVAVSTDYIFDGRKGKAYTEDDKPNPIQVYGRSKVAGEQQVRWVTERHYIVRSAWIYGRGGKNFFSKLPELIASGDPIRAVADQTGSPTYAPDLARAIVALLGTQRHGTYHITNAGACTFAQFCRHVFERAGATGTLEEITRADLGRPAPRPENTSLENIAWTEAGFPPLRPWKEAAEEFLAAAL